MSKSKRRTVVKNSRSRSAAPEKSSIAWQNKDVTSKYFGDHLKGKSFTVYGLELPEIKEVQPTNLPAIEANELRLDHLFLLKDDSLALVDYESTYADSNKIKYLSYIVRTLKRNMAQHNFPCRIRMIVIYTADIQPQQTDERLDIGCLQFQLEEAFLSRKDSEQTEARLQARFLGNQELSKEEQMEFVILPLTYKGNEEKQACIRRCFEMAKLLEDADMQRFLLSGMLVFADKVITKEDSTQIKEWIMMTKVGQLFEEEKIQYGREIEKRVTRDVTKRVTEKVTKNVTEKVTKNVTEKVTKNVTEKVTKNVTEKVTKNVTEKVTKSNELKFSKILLHTGLSIEDVSNMMTVLTIDDVQKIAKSMNLKSDNHEVNSK